MKKFLILTIVLACSSHAHEGPLFDQSVEAHEAALKTSREVTSKIKEMNTLLEGLSDDPLSLKDSLAVLKQDFIDWEKSIIEVPGYESDIHEGHDHEEHGHEGHDHHEHSHEGHDHSPAAELTMEMVLDIQKDLRDQIAKMNLRSEKLLESFKKTGL